MPYFYNCAMTCGTGGKSQSSPDRRGDWRCADDAAPDPALVIRGLISHTRCSLTSSPGIRGLSALGDPGRRRGHPRRRSRRRDGLKRPGRRQGVAPAGPARVEAGRQAARVGDEVAPRPRLDRGPSGATLVRIRATPTRSAPAPSDAFRRSCRWAGTPSRPGAGRRSRPARRWCAGCRY